MQDLGCSQFSQEKMNRFIEERCHIQFHLYFSATFAFYFLVS